MSASSTEAEIINGDEIPVSSTISYMGCSVRGLVSVEGGMPWLHFERIVGRASL